MCASSECSRPGSCVSAIGSSDLPGKLSASCGPTQPRVWLGLPGRCPALGCPPLPAHADTLRHSEGRDINAVPGACVERLLPPGGVVGECEAGLLTSQAGVQCLSHPADGRFPGLAPCGFIHSSCRGAPGGQQVLCCPEPFPCPYR